MWRIEGGGGDNRDQKILNVKKKKKNKSKF